MDVVIVEPPNAYTKSHVNTPKRNFRSGLPTLELIEASENLRTSIGSGVGMSRTIGMKQSRSNIATVNRRTN